MDAYLEQWAPYPLQPRSLSIIQVQTDHARELQKTQRSKRMDESTKSHLVTTESTTPSKERRNPTIKPKGHASLWSESSSTRLRDPPSH